MAAPQISFERPFKYVFQDPNWKNRILMGGLISLSIFIIVGIFVLAGYMKKLFLTLIKDENAPIPEIEFGTDMKEGAGLVGVGFVYGIGVAIVGGILAIIPCIGQLVLMVLSIGMMLWMPVAMMFYITRGSFSAAFDFKGILEYIKANISNLGLLIGVSILAGMIGQAGALACGVGALFTSFWSIIARTVAMADVWRASEQAAASPDAAPGNDAPPAP